MKEKIDKWVKFERDISSRTGPFELFALFLREDSQDKWDLVVAASWLHPKKKESLGKLAKEVQESFSKEDLLDLSRIVILEEDNPALKALQKAVGMEHGTAEVRDSEFFGFPIKHAFIITSQGPNSMADTPAT